MRERPVGEIILLTLTATVCFVIICVVAGVVVIEVVDPSADTGEAQRTIDGVIELMLGAVLGFMARNTMPSKPEDKMK